MGHSVLHISDLHRTPGAKLSNSQLIEELVSDRSRYTAAGIASPQAIVVSGDLVHGVRIGQPDHQAILDAQYVEALELLTELTDEFLAGDRSKLVLVPGNHDVDWNTARTAMVEVPEDQMPDSFGPWSLTSEGDLRWDWATRRLFRINDRALYDTRMRRFDELVEKFYTPAGSLLPPTIAGSGQAFELDGGQMRILALDSCHGNDCFHFDGHIPSAVLADQLKRFRQIEGIARIKIAVWHHNLAGPPAARDYIDELALSPLLSAGFQLLLHGHNHRTHATIRSIRFATPEPIGIVSAGSLCAQEKDLPWGTKRGYNILVFDDDYATVRVHARTFSERGLFVAMRDDEFASRGYVQLAFRQAPGMEAEDGSASRHLVLAAEKSLKAGNPQAARRLLQEVEISSLGFERSLAIRACVDGDDWDGVVKITTPPLSIEELTLLVRGTAALRRFDAAMSLLDTYTSQLDLPGPARQVLEQHVAMERSLHGQS